MRSKIVQGIMGFVLAFGSVIVPQLAQASHFAGGEIVITYLPNTAPKWDYELKVNVFRDRNGINAPADVDVSSFTINGHQNVDCWTVTCDIPGGNCSGGAGIDLPFYTTQCYQDLGGASAYDIGYYRYKTIITLPPSKYSNAGGYYFAASSCCRNSATDNLNPPTQGQGWITEFPPVQVNGQDFINSTPDLSLPYGDYACIGFPFISDWSDTSNPADPNRDIDGDSIRYIRTDPLDGGPGSCIFNSSGSGNYPYYQTTTWAAGYSTQVQTPRYQNQIGTEYTVSPEGEVSVTFGGSPGQIFAVGMRAIEYRYDNTTQTWNQIGSVTRDYQFYIDNCVVDPPPPFDPSPANPEQTNVQDAPDSIKNAKFGGNDVFDFYVFENTPPDELLPDSVLDYIQVKKYGVDTIAYKFVGQTQESNVLVEAEPLTESFLPGNDTISYNYEIWKEDAQGNRIELDDSLIISGVNDSGFLYVTWDPCSYSPVDSNDNLVPLVIRVTLGDENACPRPFFEESYMRIFIEKPENNEPELIFATCDTITGVDFEDSVDTYPYEVNGVQDTVNVPRISYTYRYHPNAEVSEILNEDVRVPMYIQDSDYDSFNFEVEDVFGFPYERAEGDSVLELADLQAKAEDIGFDISSDNVVIQTCEQGLIDPSDTNASAIPIQTYKLGINPTCDFIAKARGIRNYDPLESSAVEDNYVDQKLDSIKFFVDFVYYDIQPTDSIYYYSDDFDNNDIRLGIDVPIGAQNDSIFTSNDTLVNTTRCVAPIIRKQRVEVFIEIEDAGTEVNLEQTTLSDFSTTQITEEDDKVYTAKTQVNDSSSVLISALDSTNTEIQVPDTIEFNPDEFNSDFVEFHNLTQTPDSSTLVQFMLNMDSLRNQVFPLPPSSALVNTMVEEDGDTIGVYRMPMNTLYIDSLFDERLYVIDTSLYDSKIEYRYAPTCEDWKVISGGMFQIYQVYVQQTCMYEVRDTLIVNMDIVGPSGDWPNVVTDNNDGYNDVLRLSKEGQVLPYDCDYEFNNISVFNRWGQEVHKTEIRDFTYDPPSNIPAGTYFYIINYDGADPIKGWFELIK